MKVCDPGGAQDVAELGRQGGGKYAQVASKAGQAADAMVSVPVLDAADGTLPVPSPQR